MGIGVVSLGALGLRLRRSGPTGIEARQQRLDANEKEITDAWRWLNAPPVCALHAHEASEHGPAGVTAICRAGVGFEALVFQPRGEPFRSPAGPSTT
jgi:hypothetical protein